MDSITKYNIFVLIMENIKSYLEELITAPDYPIFSQTLRNEDTLAFYQSLHTFIHILITFISQSHFETEDIEAATECQREIIDRKWNLNYLNILD